ncbi:unnamed protein product [Arctia plantaginis]|uniref:Aftiphilin clathrin-binding box domain-containing protein n=1 Tax=Arctia plantaginis TaxID=874455 RepID=A0A8S1AHJ4_ARCPL|nr:unnamed protein product [Arctia plantaginis]
MSIPPLVCSTPPPPDQCEDDKDPGDFDLSYSLSQEDDDDDENNVYYGNFSSYNTFQRTPDNKPLEIQEQEVTKNDSNETQKEVILTYDSEKESETSKVVHNVFGTNDINENKLKCDEDMNIEDLNLKVDEEIESIIENNSIQIDTSEPNIVIVKNFDIPSSSNNDSPICDNVSLSAFDDNPIDTTDPLKELNSDADNNLQDNVISSENDSDKTQKLEEIEITSDPNLQAFDESSNFTETKPKENIVSDDFSDFGDFDDFQSVNSNINVSNIVERSDNPWVNDDSNEFEFGNFAVNFEDKFNTVDNVTLKSESVSNNIDQLNSEIKEIDNQSEDDDFGDFDDFKSSTTKTEANEVEDPSYCHHELSVLNLQSAENEHQILESITNVVSSVFLEEITEPQSEFEGKLESLLSETWGHLMETDERQPYIVHWNNSLGQKTLLKALCIDSRNILFGPKWSSNMPKYAANLSNAPLQPQKQASDSSTVTQNEIVAEKPLSKPTIWNDSFTEGQESCNTENVSATITSGSTDLDVFESSAATKADKIYSNTIGVQPLRQINLPDTHIFTPTDSEVPRSKTIHYDHAPAVLLPQTAPDTINEKHVIKTPNIKSTLENNVDDSEYWEFQNFKSNSDKSEQVLPQENNLKTAKIVNTLPKPNMAYQTELLQPIKVESTMPSLNWPDPGEVKEAFDDFSDFVSSSQSTTEKQDSHSIQSLKPRLEQMNINKLDSFSVHTDKTNVVSEFTNPDINALDDDFDTFQSAQPSNSTSKVFKRSFSENPTNQTPISHITEFDKASPKFDSTKSESISFGSTSRPTEALTQNLSFIPNKTEQSPKSLLSLSSQMQTNLLQPTPASFSAVNLQNQQKSTQILQPLSLESYSQINWPSPGIDLQDLSRFNPVETLHSLKSDLSVSGLNKAASPIHTAKNTMVNQGADDDVWGEFVSSKPKQQQAQPKKPSVFVDDDEWTDFISSPSVKPVNGLNTISLNVHTNSNIQKSVQNRYAKKGNQPPLDIPTLNYITPKSNPHMSYNDKHFQNL